ncbi:MAG: D-alanyl-D-alanine carboxypeptidase family protein [Hyphomicrobiales bacterium]
MPFLAVLIAALIALALPAAAQEKQAEPDFQTSAPHAIVMDATTGEVFFEKDADTTFEPASMSKLMTMVMTFEAIRRGDLKEDDLLTITEDAWRRGGAPSGGSTMYAELNSKVAVSDLIKGTIIQSANDAAITLATRLGGTEEAFAAKETERARELGLKKSVFRNSTGLPDPDHVSTARELAMLARYIIETFPEYYKLYGTREFTWNRITQKNRNPLLGTVDGADGMKTGYTSKAGYGLIGSATRDGRRLIIVVAGLDTAQARAKEAQNLIEQGFKKYRRFDILTAGDTLVTARVWGGERGSVKLMAREPMKALLTDAERSAARVKVVYKGPLIAPVSKETAVGVAKLVVGDAEIGEVPVFPKQDIGARDGVIGRSLDTLGVWVFGG